MTENAVMDSQPTTTPTAEPQGTVSAPTITGEPTAQAAQEFDLTKYIDAKTGEFKQGWQDGLLDEQHRQLKFFNSGIKDIKGLLSIAGNQSHLIGKKTIAPINEKSTPAEIEEFRRNWGVPDTYKFESPKDIYLVDLTPEANAERFSRINKLNLNQGQFDGVMQEYANNMLELQKAIEENDKAEFEEAERIIMAESGNDYDDRVHLANRVIEDNTANWPQDKKDKFLDAINESTMKPYVLDFIATVGKKFTEHKLIADLETGMGISDIDVKIKEKMMTPEYLDRNSPLHKIRVAEVQQMYAEKERRKQKDNRTSGPV